MEIYSPPINTSFPRKLGKLKKIGIDSMCLIYQFQSHPLFGPLVYKVFSRLEEHKLIGVTSVLAIAEILSFKKLQENRKAFDEERQKFDQIPNLEIINVDSKLCVAAAIIRAKYSLRLPDAIQLTTAIFCQADGFITNDEGLRKVKEVEIVLLKDYLK